MSIKTTRSARLLTILVALVAMTMSYHALALRAEESGIDRLLAWVYPLGLDGLIGVGMLAAHALRGARRRVRAYVWGVFGFGITVSGLGNALPLDMPGALFRLVPPISLALALHLLIVLSRREPVVRAAKRTEPAEPEQSRAPVHVLPTSGPARSRTANAREALALARSQGRLMRAPELAREAKISESRARAIIGERRAQASVSG